MVRKLILVAPLLIGACSPALPSSGQTLPPPNVTIIPASSAPTGTRPPTATRTTRAAIDAYTIDGLRLHDYGSGKIIIRGTLLETRLFTRYLIEYPSDGLTISGILQVPVSGTPPYPVIVMNHGFFSRRLYSSGDGTDRAAEFLNRRGYLTISSDYRSWGFSETGESLFYSGLVIDVINLVNALPSLKQADPNRIGMWGHSMGGGVTLKVLTIDPRIKAAVLYSSVSGDFADILDRWGPGCLGDVLQGELAFGCNSSDIIPSNMPADLVAAYFDTAEDADLIQAVSPLYYLDYVTAPVQITYGSEDGETSAGTPPEWSKKIYQAFIDANKAAWLFGHEGEGHSLLADEWFAFMERSAKFYDLHVRAE